MRLERLRGFLQWTWRCSNMERDVEKVPRTKIPTPSLNPTSHALTLPFAPAASSQLSAPARHTANASEIITLQPP
eukprot:2067654-Rhodomonas_salina.2